MSSVMARSFRCIGVVPFVCDGTGIIKHRRAAGSRSDDAPGYYAMVSAGLARRRGDRLRESLRPYDQRQIGLSARAHHDLPADLAARERRGVDVDIIQSG